MRVRVEVEVRVRVIVKVRARVRVRVRVKVRVRIRVRIRVRVKVLDSVLTSVWPCKRIKRSRSTLYLFFCYCFVVQVFGELKK